MKRTFSILILFFITLGNINAQNNPIDGVIAVVGQKIILRSDLETQLLHMKAQGTKINDDTRCQVFEEILYQTLLLNQSELDSIEVPEMQVESELNRRISLFEDQMGGRTQLEDYYGKSFAEIKEYFREMVRDQMKTQRMQANITENVKVSPQQVKEFYKKMPKDSLPLVESELEISQIVIYPEIKDTQIKKIKEELKEYKQRVENGEDFTVLASLYSDDLGSAEDGGELGWVRRGDLVPEFSEAAFALQNEGEMSEIIKTDFGYHLIQFIERKGTKIRVRHILRIPKPLASENMKAKNKLDSIAVLIRKGYYTFESAAEKFSQDDNTKQNGGILINQYTGMTKFKSGEIDPSTNYILKQLKIGEISDPFENRSTRGKNEIKIIRIKSRTEAHIADFKTDYQKISDLALEAKKKLVVDDWIREKQKTTFINIEPEFRKCKFTYSGWLK